MFLCMYRMHTRAVRGPLVLPLFLDRTGYVDHSGAARNARRDRSRISAPVSGVAPRPLLSTFLCARTLRGQSRSPPCLSGPTEGAPPASHGERRRKRAPSWSRAGRGSWDGAWARAQMLPLCSARDSAPLGSRRQSRLEGPGASLSLTKRGPARASPRRLPHPAPSRSPSLSLSLSPPPLPALLRPFEQPSRFWQR